MPPWVPDAFFLNIPVAIHRVVAVVSTASWEAASHGLDLENLLVSPPAACACEVVCAWSLSTHGAYVTCAGLVCMDVCHLYVGLGPGLARPAGHPILAADMDISSHQCDYGHRVGQTFAYITANH